MATQVWGVNAAGGFCASPSIDYTFRQKATKTTYFHQSTTSVGSFGKHRSDRILIDKAGRLAEPMDTSGTAEAEATPETSFAIVQASIIAGEYNNSVSWTERLDTFSQFPIINLVGMVLRQDQIEGLDAVAFAAYATGQVVYTPQTATTGVFATAGTASIIAGSSVSPFHMRDVTDYMRSTLLVPPLLEGDYLTIATTDWARGMKDSGEFLDTAKYAKPELLFRSEIGKYAGQRVVEENNALDPTAGTTTENFGQAVTFGADNVMEVVAQAPHLRYGIPVDFGRDRREGHFYMGGFGILWRYDTDSGEEHQVRWDSL